VKQDALAAGCNEVLAKPLDLESLLVKIKTTLGLLHKNPKPAVAH
jgi:CheY-like chemotaxis protein